MGGYLAPRSAACDTRIKACAFAGGMYDRTRELNRLEDPFEFARVAHIWKVYDKQKLVELHSRCTLEGLAPKIRCPLLVVHGEKDFVPVEQAKRTYDEASRPKEWLLLKVAITCATTCRSAIARDMGFSCQSTWEPKHDFSFATLHVCMLHERSERVGKKSTFCHSGGSGNPSVFCTCIKTSLDSGFAGMTNLKFNSHPHDKYTAIDPQTL